MSHIMLHKGAIEATRNALEVQNTLNPVKPMGPRHHPVPHYTFIDTLCEAAEGAGFEITSEVIARTPDMGRVFALLNIQHKDLWTDKQTGLAIAGMNSIDQTLSARVAVGTNCFVCDNLALSGEYTLRHKNTLHLGDRLEEAMNQAMGHVKVQARKNDYLIDQMRQRQILDISFHDTCIKAMQQGVLAASKLPKVVEEWHAPRHEEWKERTAWTALNCFTEVLKGSNPFDLAHKVGTLEEILVPTAQRRWLEKFEEQAEEVAVN